ncbi:ABC transporter ATP-binding protein [Microbacterium capsulatum]|uniref:ABC transporter ATP-binding protein n=1 Tax=Microbacterium capsulatum TaxID=3041921 RepID=A0ABU0XEN9_9MICO|nr:ABC transporter ATP-binding protein [Microbacterium sp. ASV81]MDQ4213584.1 ABC transporter ATP-binding protein [Microbacterium sp. ASV81]
MSQVAPAPAGTDFDEKQVLLSVRDLQTEFVTPGGTVSAVRGVSFDIHRRERVAIVGESGSGKSAMAMSVVGLLQHPGRVVGGSVELNGKSLRGRKDADLARLRGKEVSLVFQDPMSAFDPIRTIGAQMVESIQAHQNVNKATARKIAADALGEVGITNPAGRLSDYPHQYSGGMRQRVLIAMALVNSPDLVIADEPTTALDVTTQAQVLELLDRLVRERGAALMLITHNLGIVAGYCDSVKVMYAGQLVEEAPVTELFGQPGHPYSQALIDCVVRPDTPRTDILPSIPGALPDPTKPIIGCSFEPRCKRGHGDPLCQTQTPVMIQLGRGPLPHSAACHYAKEFVQ